MDKPTCKTCLYFQPMDFTDSGEMFGQCRRSAPKHSPAYKWADADGKLHWATDGGGKSVADSYWCGEHSEWYKWTMELQAQAVEKARQQRQEAETCTTPSALSADPGTTASST